MALCATSGHCARWSHSLVACALLHRAGRSVIACYSWHNFVAPLSSQALDAWYKISTVQVVKSEISAEMASRDSRSANWLRLSLIAIVLVYAFLAGLRTVADFDTGWQLATGRYIVQHHGIPIPDTFSYTARGRP